LRELTRNLFRAKILKIFKEEIEKKKRECVKKRRREYEKLCFCVFRSGGSSIYRGWVWSETEWEKTALHHPCMICGRHPPQCSKINTWIGRGITSTLQLQSF